MPVPPKAASSATAAVNRAALQKLAFDDVRDFEGVRRGFIAELPDNGVIRDAAGDLVWDLAWFSFVEAGEPAPDSVHPSLWRQSQLITEAGLYEVSDRIYQVRNHDLANVTIIEGDGGLIVVDTGSKAECAKVAMDLYYAHRPEKLPVVAVIYTHTHIDHYGGITGIVTPEEVASGRVAILAPGENFEKYALGENVTCGNVMSRRAAHAFGTLLPHGPLGFVTDGGGLALPPTGTFAYLPPTDTITTTGERRTLAGLEFVFQMAPDTEAPEEFHFYIPELKALTCAENANHSLHNIQTLRGARTRDAANFARCLDEAMELFPDAEVHYGPHTWPVWGRDNVRDFLGSQRDAYKYLHDQALRLANHGLTPIEIAEQLDLPPALGRAWWNRGYHGTVNHNLKAVYAKELGWYDGNPMHLHPLPPAESAQRYVEAIGGTERVVELAREAFEAGDYRWVVELAGQAVFADPGNHIARGIQADAYEQLGYQSEGPQWRNLYLTAAQELRDGVPTTGVQSTGSIETVMAMPLDLFLDFIAVRLNGPKAADTALVVNLDLTDGDQPGPHSLQLANGVLHHRPRHTDNADLTLRLGKAQLAVALLKPGALGAAVEAGQVTADGDLAVFVTLTGLLDDFSPYFALTNSNA
ncbi:alkyl/aryl-sulfatase [Streptomyces sp. BF23-18]|uniref:alkyl/aryl-sulfatase n=1 Tax=Streptomyces sp. BF23-18 TaxID=3240282 RepID=UPI0034E4E837